MNPTLRKARRRAKEDLFYLARHVLGFDYLIEKFHKPICDFMQDMSVHRRQLEMPRGFLKTTICSIAKPIWRSINDPNARILLANMIYDNAAKNVHVIRMKWEKCKKLRVLFPELIPNFRRTRWSDACAEINRSGIYDVGTYEAIGVGGTKIGSHYTDVYEDDLVGARIDNLSGQEILPNSMDTEKAIGWHALATNLLANPSEGYIDNVGTRWGQYDLIRHIKDKQPYYKRFVKRAVEMDEKGVVLRHANGDYIPTYPKRFNAQVLREIQEEQGDYLFSMMYLGKPYNVEDMIFQIPWFKIFKGEPPVGNTYAGLDAAFAKGTSADYSAIPIVRFTPEGELYVIHYVQKRMNPTEIIKEIFLLFDTWHFQWIAVERTTYEQTLCHYIEKENRNRVKEGKIPVRVELVSRPKGESKAMHIRAIQPLAMAGKFYIRDWMHALLTQFREFTGRKGDKDDLLDALADIFARVRYPQRPRPAKVVNPMSVEAVLNELLVVRRDKMRGVTVQEAPVQEA